MKRLGEKRLNDDVDISKKKKRQYINTSVVNEDTSRKVLGSKKKEPAEELLEKFVFGKSVDDSDSEGEDAASGLQHAHYLEYTSSEEESDCEGAISHALPQNRLQDAEGVLDREKRKPVWFDETDEAQLSFQQETSYRQDKVKRRDEEGVGGKQLQQRLKSQFEKVVGNTPAWARLKSERDNEVGDSDGSDEDEDDDEPLLRHTGNYLTTSQRLPKSNLNIKRMTNLNKEQRTEGKVSSVEFHPSAQVAMVTGLDQRLNLFQVEARHSPKIQSVFVEEFPITCAHFTSQGSEVVLSGRRKFFYAYDMIVGKVTKIPYIRGIQESKLEHFEASPDGRFLAFLGDRGNIHLLSVQTKELITTLKMNGSVAAVTFTSDGTKMMSIGDDGDVYVWDMATRDCIHKFADDGCIKGTTISVSSGNQFIATGSQSGVVNIYNDQCFSSPQPKPMKAVMNLTTPVKATKFNSTNEILAAVSVYSNNVVKLVHLPSCCTFQNFPRSSDKLQAPCAIDFSPRSGYFALGKWSGDVLLYRIKHYTEY